MDLPTLAYSLNLSTRFFSSLFLSVLHSAKFESLLIPYSAYEFFFISRSSIQIYNTWLIFSSVFLNVINLFIL